MIKKENKTAIEFIELYELYKKVREIDNINSRKKCKDSIVERGERGHFLKVTVTLPPETFSDLKKLGIERKLSGEKDTDVSSLIRESLNSFLETYRGEE